MTDKEIKVYIQAAIDTHERSKAHLNATEMLVFAFLAVIISAAATSLLLKFIGAI